MILVSRRVCLPDGVRPAAVAVAGGVITAVAPPDGVDELRRRQDTERGTGPRDGDRSPTIGHEVVDVGDLAILPGAVDPHVHVNEPGRTGWEGFDSATRAAAAGGVTTIVDMPLNCSPVTTTAAALDRKERSARGSCWVDCGFWGGIVPANVPAGDGASEAVEELDRGGVLGFKCFTCPSGLDEFPPVTESDLGAVLPLLARRDASLLVHAEDPATLAAASDALRDAPRRYSGWLASRPAEAEVRAISGSIRACGRHGVRLHVVHLSASSALPEITRARRRGRAVTVETCPHYLTFAAGEIPPDATLYKCAPPIRGAADRDALWRGLLEGTIDLVASDHSPCPPEMKHLDAGDFSEAWGGIASLQLTRSVLWSQASRRGFGLEELARWTSAAPARLARLDDRKGAIAVGLDADLVVFDPDATFTVDPTGLHHRHPLTPYAGRTVRGRVVQTFLRGRKVYDHGEIVGAPGGRIQRRAGTDDGSRP